MQRFDARVCAFMGVLQCAVGVAMHGRTWWSINYRDISYRKCIRGRLYVLVYVATSVREREFTWPQAAPSTIKRLLVPFAFWRHAYRE